MQRFLTPVLGLVVAGCFAASGENPRPGDLRVHRGDFTSEIVLSGELEAARGQLLSVPPLPNWETNIKWIADDGTAVHAGDSVVELDNSALTTDLESKRQGASQAAQELQQREAEWQADLENLSLDLEKKRLALEKATIDVSVPAELQSRRAFEEKQTALRKAKAEHEKATELLASKRTAVEADRRNLLLNIEKTRRSITIAEEAIRALRLTAPRDGIFVVRDHPWEGRKMQEGDRVWVGFPIGLIPELDSLRVNAALADVDDGRIKVGMPVKITLDGYPDMEVDGTISAISAVAQESRRQSLRRQFEVQVAIGRLDLERMRPGLTARVVVGRETKKGALLASRAAIDFGGRTPVARLDGGKTKPVTLGTCNALECVVLSGLEEGERLEPIVEVGRG